MKLTQEDIQKYGKEDEKKTLKEGRGRTSPAEQGIVKRLAKIQYALGELLVCDDMVELSMSLSGKVYRDIEKLRDNLEKIQNQFHEWVEY